MRCEERMKEIQAYEETYYELSNGSWRLEVMPL
jgi:hypothetical protein